MPVFIAVLGLVTTLCAKKAVRRNRRALLILQAALLAGFLAVVTVLGPFANPDSGTAVSAGMLGVAAMAIQNAIVKLALPGSPSTAVMTTNTTQLAIDLAIISRGRSHPEDLARARHRAVITFPSVLGFLAEGAAGAFLEIHLGLKALVLPLVLAVIAVPLGERWSDAGA